MGTSNGLAGTFALVALVAWSFGAKALAADAKAELIEREHKCVEAPTVDEAMECYVPGDDLVLYDINTPREFDGAKAVRADFQPFFENFKNPKYDYSNERAILAGKLAFTNLIVHMTATDKKRQSGRYDLALNQRVAQRERNVEDHSGALFRSRGHGERQSRHAVEAVTGGFNFNPLRCYSSIMRAGR